MFQNNWSIDEWTILYWSYLTWFADEKTEIINENATITVIKTKNTKLEALFFSFNVSYFRRTILVLRTFTPSFHWMNLVFVLIELIKQQSREIDWNSSIYIYIYVLYLNIVYFIILLIVILNIFAHKVLLS